MNGGSGLSELKLHMETRGSKRSRALYGRHIFLFSFSGAAVHLGGSMGVILVCSTPISCRARLVLKIVVSNTLDEN